MKAWYSSSVLSRLEGQGGIILMHQRWHQDDLAGYLLREYADDGWRVVHMPALIETQEDKDVDYLGRDFGESLVPQLHSTEKLLRLKKTMLHRDWMSMYQGQPHDSEGEEFTKDMILRYEQESIVVRQSMNVYIVVDPADSKNKYSDYTAMAVIGLGSDGNYYILDLVREKLDLNERTKTLLDLHRKWRPLSVSYESYGATADIQHIQYVQNEQNYRFPINKLGNAPGQKLNKIERIRRVIPDMLNGRWYAPDHLVKIGMDGQKYEPIELLIEEEMLPFPNSSKHDDAIDAISRVYDLNLIWPSGMNRVTNGVSNQKDKGKVSPW
jgi:predicted phage terminase large subunit-like protein